MFTDRDVWVNCTRHCCPAPQQRDLRLSAVVGICCPFQQGEAVKQPSKPWPLDNSLRTRRYWISMRYGVVFLSKGACALLLRWKMLH